MQFMDDSLLPENQDPLIIQVAPYAPSFFPRDSDDIPLTMAEQVQKAVDCYNAGATLLHVHVREPDTGKGSKRLEMFNEMLDRLRTAVPKMILQVGGSISFAPKDDGEAAKWLSDDTRHMLAELDPKPGRHDSNDLHLYVRAVRKFLFKGLAPESRARRNVAVEPPVRRPTRVAVGDAWAVGGAVQRGGNNR